PVFCRRPRDDGDNTREQLSLDGEAAAANPAYFRHGGVDHSPSPRYLALGRDVTGAETYTLHVRDLETGDDSQPPIAHPPGVAQWAADSGTLFYTTLDDAHRPCRIWRLALGAEPDTAELVYEEADPGFFVSVSTTQSQRFILINAHHHE